MWFDAFFRYKKAREKNPFLLVWGFVQISFSAPDTVGFGFDRFSSSKLLQQLGDVGSLRLLLTPLVLPVAVQKWSVWELLGLG